MPRPPFKRRRSNNFHPSERVAKVDSNAARQEHDRKMAGKPVGKRPADSDDSDNLVTRATPAQARRNPPRAEIYASGAVGKGDKPGAYPTRAQRRQIMTQTTNEILKERSRSTSRAGSVASNASAPLQGPAASLISPNTPKERANAGIFAATSPVRQTDAVTSATKKVSNTPLPEHSVLGVLKPRKRQASILQLIDNNDDSSIHSEDEEEFLPDGISTPLESNLKRQARHSELSRGQSETKKRKRDSNVPAEVSSMSRRNTQISHATDKEITREPMISPDLPAPTRTQSRKLEQREAEEEDVMAPPESSDSEISMSKSKRSSTKPTTRQSKPTAPSTDQLKSLMPSTRYTSTRQRDKHINFEIPEDSDSQLRESVSEVDDHSAFLPRKSKRGTKAQRKQPLSRPDNVRPKGVASSGTSSKSKSKIKSTNITISTPPSARLRKPLPLSSSRPGNVEAKSPSQKQGVLTTNENIKPTVPAVGKTVKRRFGGSHPRTSGKENEPVTSSNEVLGNVMEEEDDTVEIQVGRGQNGRQAWNKQWAEIDDFSLDFEDVSASLGGSSSPLAR